MVLVTSIKIDTDIFAIYRYRWSIERLFKHLKSGGFDIKKTHIINLDRFKKLVVVAAIASALIVKNGLIQNSLNPIRIKRHKTVEKQLFSIFTYGFDHIKSIFYQSIDGIISLIRNLLISKTTLILPIIPLSQLKSYGTMGTMIRRKFITGSLDPVIV